MIKMEVQKYRGTCSHTSCCYLTTSKTVGDWCGEQERGELEVWVVYIGVLQNLDCDEKNRDWVSNMGD